MALGAGCTVLTYRTTRCRDSRDESMGPGWGGATAPPHIPINLPRQGNLVGFIPEIRRQTRPARKGNKDNEPHALAHAVQRRIRQRSASS